MVARRGQPCRKGKLRFVTEIPRTRVASHDVNFNRIIDRYMEVGYARSVIRLMLFSTRHFIFHLSRQINCMQSELGKKFCIFDAFRFEGSSRHLDTETDKNDHLFGAST